MSAKAPIYLKRGSRRGKKEKLRDVLSSDMISPPLGDFRHTIHVGSGGCADMFGDVSFLQGKFHLLPGGPEAATAAVPFAFPRASTVCSHEAPSPLLKNAVSLPLLGGPRALTLLPAPAPPKPPRLHLEGREENGRDSTSAPPPQPCAAAAAAANGFAREAGGAETPFLSHAGSLLSLHVDLGPSILEDVLQVMEKHQADGTGGAAPEAGRRELLT